MYLIKIDTKTGLIAEDVTNESWAGINCFRELVERDGMKALTAVALSVDYLSIYNHYEEKDRIIRVIIEIYGNRKKYNIEDELFVECLSKYKELQYNADLEQERIYEKHRHNLLSKISKAMNEEDEAAIDRYTMQLNKHNQSVQKFQKGFDKVKAIESAVTISGYSLSRIENEIRSRKNSKFLDIDNSVNPKKLDLENQF